MDGDELVDSLTTLGTPHLGTYAAYLGYFSEGGRELKPDSDVIRRLNRDGVEPNVSYNGIWGTKDLLVLPRKNGKVPDETLENVSNFEVNCGHLK
ncbi:MAG: hypothetical protein SV760_10410, partial [Halobacteria archaeon]|nr:hypothetical protein [Halobacteria archaeon]